MRRLLPVIERPDVPGGFNAADAVGDHDGRGATCSRASGAASSLSLLSPITETQSEPKLWNSIRAAPH
ncbi:MAG: hypothetical protein M1435_04160 [Actinobacteria bacterium]|nr:hypothetical protein [Actinomycetota bacterium]